MTLRTLAALWLTGCLASAGAHALARQAEDPQALVTEGRKLNRAGRQDEALALYERALKMDPQMFDALLAAGVALDLKGDYARARTYLQRAIDLAPEEARPQALGAMAVSHAFEKNAAEAAKYYQQQFDLMMTAQRLDGAASTANAMARAYLESGDPDNAEKWYRTGYETARKLTGLPPDQVDLWALRWHHARSRIAARRGNAAEAATYAAEVKAIVDKGGPNTEQEPAYQYLVGYNALYAGRYDAAIAELLKADQADPFILGLLAQAFEKKGDTAQAKEYYGRALQSNGHNLQNAFTRPLARQKLAQLK
jgi:tetratricopeptide (TPR) repeat protein